MTTDTTVVIKGRNELTYAVKQAQQQLKELDRTAQGFGKFLRGGAIVGAAMAFERLAENAQHAAEQLGDRGTAEALRKLNAQIDTLKAKGTNVIGKVLGNVYSAFSSDRALQLREQIDFLRQMSGRSFVAAGYKDIGTGFFTAAEGAAKLLELEKKLAVYDRNLPFGERTRTPGSHGGGRSAILAPLERQRGSKTVAPTDPEMDAYIAGLERAGAAQRHFEDTLADADKMIRDSFGDSLERGAEQLEQLGSTSQLVMDQMTVFAEQAGRNMQDAFAAYLFDPFKGGLDDMLASFLDTIRRMVAEAAAQEILGSFFSWGSGLGGAVGKFFGSLAGRASGGPVSAGTAYLVGERGRELFVPGSNGTIVPNAALAGAGGVTLNQSISIDARGADAERIIALLPGWGNTLREQTIAEVRALIGRGRLT